MITWWHSVRVAPLFPPKADSGWVLVDRHGSEKWEDGHDAYADEAFLEDLRLRHAAV